MAKKDLSESHEFTFIYHILLLLLSSINIHLVMSPFLGIILGHSAWSLGSSLPKDPEIYYRYYISAGKYQTYSQKSTWIKNA